MTIAEAKKKQDLANYDRMLHAAGGPRVVLPKGMDHPTWPEQEKSTMCATSPDPTRRVSFITHADARLVIDVLAAIDTRGNDYVDSGAISGRDLDVLEQILERLQEEPDIDPLTGRPMKGTLSMSQRQRSFAALRKRSAGRASSDGGARRSTAGRSCRANSPRPNNESQH